MNKKLCLSKDKKICGVCGGIAEYFNADPTLVRIGCVLAVFLGGISFWVYFIAALVMPNAPVDDWNQNYNYNPNNNYNQDNNYNQNNNYNQ